MNWLQEYATAVGKGVLLLIGLVVATILTLGVVFYTVAGVLIAVATVTDLLSGNSLYWWRTNPNLCWTAFAVIVFVDAPIVYWRFDKT